MAHNDAEVIRATVELIESRRHESLMLHAAALADPKTGATAALVGPSGRGKTTAASHLGTRLAYLSDETTIIDPETLAITPYAKPLSVKRNGAPGKDQVPPDELGLRTLDDDVTPVLAALCLLDRDSEAGPDQPIVEIVPLREAIADLVPQISFLGARPASLQNLADVVAHVGGVRRIRYREAAQLIDVIGPLLRHPPAPSPRPHEAAPNGSAADTGYRRALAHDAVRTDDGAVIVLHQNQVRVLDGIGPLIWAHADGISLDALTAAIVAEVGAPDGDARALVKVAADELVAAGLILHDSPIVEADASP